jgi:hypothetical protein
MYFLKDYIPLKKTTLLYFFCIGFIEVLFPHPSTSDRNKGTSVAEWLEHHVKSSPAPKLTRPGFLEKISNLSLSFILSLRFHLRWDFAQIALL